MRAQESRPRIFYGWYIVGACFVTMATAVGVGSILPVFFEALIGEFGWSRTAFSGAFSIYLVLAGLSAPLWGKWTDRSGARVVVIASAVFSGICLSFFARISTLWHIYLFSALAAFAVSGMDLVPISTAVSQWFRSRRGIAMGVTLIGGGVGGFVMPPLSNYLLELVGWRRAYLLIAAMVWIIIIPIAGLVLRRRPQDLGLLSDGETAPDDHERGREVEKDSASGEDSQESHPQGITLGAATKKFAFWMIAIAFFLPMMSAMGIMSHLVIMFKDLGVSSQAASMWFGLIAALGIIGSLGFGRAADSFGVRRVYTAAYIAETVGVCILLTTPLFGAKALCAYVIVYGITGGGSYTLAPLIVGECFGLKAFGTIFGVLAIAGTIGGAAGPLLSGYIFDTTGSYFPAFIIFCVCEAVSAIAISQAHSPLSEKRYVGVT